MLLPRSVKPVHCTTVRGKKKHRFRFSIKLKPISLLFDYTHHHSPMGLRHITKHRSAVTNFGAGHPVTMLSPTPWCSTVEDSSLCSILRPAFILNKRFKRANQNWVGISNKSQSHRSAIMCPGSCGLGAKLQWFSGSSGPWAFAGGGGERGYYAKAFVCR